MARIKGIWVLDPGQMGPGPNPFRDVGHDPPVHHCPGLKSSTNEVLIQ